ncbi:hypothetical protein Rs2_16845 [Raphanus sativus]|nr:hypothetical protein Rs2_16845 [Raphanus sativus]
MLVSHARLFLYLQGLRDLSAEGSIIRVKRMGEVDEKPFLKVCELKFSGENVDLQHAMLRTTRHASLEMAEKTRRFQHGTHLNEWGMEKKMKEVVDDEDEKLKSFE